MKKTLLSAIAMIAMLATQAQYASLVSRANNYGKLFSDAGTLCEIVNDSLNTLDPATGVRTLVSKLPAPPSTAYGFWGGYIAMKTATGYVLDQQLLDKTTSQSVELIWAYNGSSWDTIMPAIKTIIIPPARIKNKYFMMILDPTSKEQFIATDFTRSGTITALTTIGDIWNITQLKRDGERVYFGTQINAQTYIYHTYMMTDSSIKVIDSSKALNRNLGVINQELIYVSTDFNFGISRYDVQIRKYNPTTNSTVVLTTQGGGNGAGQRGVAYGNGITWGGKLVVSKLDSGKTNNSLVGLNPANGSEIVLTVDNGNPYGTYYRMEESATGANYAFIFTTDSSTRILATDGVTVGGAKAIYRGVVNFNSYIGANYSILCDDQLFTRGLVQNPTNTSTIQQLYHANISSVNYQSLNNALYYGSKPQSFVKVGPDNNQTIYFTASGVVDTGRSMGFPNEIYGLYKIENCGSASVSIEEALANDLLAKLYPNPATDRVKVALDASIAAATLALYDITGRVVLTQEVSNGVIISTASIPSGMYLYRIATTEGIVHTSRVSIVH